MIFHPAFKSYTLVGTFIMLVYGFIWGIYAVLVKIYFRGIDSRIGFSVVSIYTVIALFILILFKGNPAQCLNMPIGGWASIIISGILGIAVGHVTYYISIRRLGPMTPSLIQLVQPFIVIVFSYFIFCESLSIPQMIFGIVLISGSAMAITAEKDNGPQTV
jgi:drug/metabolite transporter (DMT)-like permease